MRQPYQSIEDWAASKVADFPPRWRKKILGRYLDKLATVPALPCVSGEGGRSHTTYTAGRELCEIVGRLEAVRLPLNASDSDITDRANELAEKCFKMAAVVHEIEYLRFSMNRICQAVGVLPAGVIEKKTEDGIVLVRSKRMTVRAAIARMTCRDWWRRALRKVHAKAVEGAAIELGYVNKARDLYVSNESLERRGQQIRRNTLTLENTLMRNELDQEFTLAELASRGTANKAIRRGELMTRIAGFEKIAVECGHGGLFLTVTCPSRMHKWISAGSGKVFENTKYDGTTPREAQKYLGKCYSRIRAKLARVKIGIYGFRIAEPHHDGCPHWHILAFHQNKAAEQIEEVFRKYLLADSPDEKGAAQHRVKVEKIDWSRGTAAGYIAKYVAKNIDGLHVENDLYGNPAMETSLRVEAWASTWGIRQFQQVGGAPVGVWREIRRIKEMPAGAPAHLKAAHVAVNKIEVGDGETKSADWAGYCKAQGGVFVGRAASIKIATEETGELGRYGEIIAPRPVGVETVGGEFYRDGIVPDRFRLVEWLVQSVRHVWQVVKGRVSAAVFSPPWTCVNNCTRGEMENEANGGGGAVERSREGMRGATADDESVGIGGGFAFDRMPSACFS